MQSETDRDDPAWAGHVALDLPRALTLVTEISNLTVIQSTLWNGTPRAHKHLVNFRTHPMVVHVDCA